MSFRILYFELESSGSVTLELTEKESYCSQITVKVQTSSSIPDQTSSIITYITEDTDKYYRGADPTIVNLLMTPSLFLSNTGTWDSEATGYHISQTQDLVKGSQIDYTE